MFAVHCLNPPPPVSRKYDDSKLLHGAASDDGDGDGDACTGYMVVGMMTMMRMMMMMLMMLMVMMVMMMMLMMMMVMMMMMMMIAQDTW